jgi:hypothetical protein
MDGDGECMHFDLEKSAKAVVLTDQSQRFTGPSIAPLSLGKEGTEMRFLAALAALCALSGAVHAETRDCKTLTDPAARLTCYDKINPPIATYPIPLPKPSHPIPLTRPDGTPGMAETSDSSEDAMLHARMNSICRGC